MADPISSRELLGLFRRSPARIVSFFRRKGYQFSFDWRDVWQAEHARAFTVAKAMNDQILAELRAGVDAAIVDGWSSARFVKEMTPRLRASGWWGKAAIVNPKTGVLQQVQLGSAWRLRTIYRTNSSTAFGRGKYETQVGNTDRRPFWMYDARNDSLTREAHREMDNRVYRHDDPIWGSIYPPNGFNCRCLVRALTADDMAKQGLRLTDGNASPPFEGFPDNGWDYNPGNETLPAFKARLARPPIPPRPILTPPSIPIRSSDPPLIRRGPRPGSRPPVPRKSKMYAPESLHENGRPIVREQWLEKWIHFSEKAGEHKLGTNAGFMKLIKIFDQPRKLLEGSGAFFRRGYTQRGSLNMGSHNKPGDLYDRSVFRHEMGHHLDERIARYHMSEGRAGISGPYISAGPEAQKALLLDTKGLNDIGKKTYKKTIKMLEARGLDTAGLSKTTRKFTTDRLDYAWYKRREILAHDLMKSTAIPDAAKALKDAKAILNKDKSLLGKLWRAYQKAPAPAYAAKFLSSDILLWAEAAKSGEISFLLQTKSRHIFRNIFKARKWSDEALSDLFGAISNEDVAGVNWGYGHSKAYYSTRKFGSVRMGQGTEAFANLTDLSVARGDKLFEDILEAFVPKYTSWYDKLIAEILNDAKNIIF